MQRSFLPIHLNQAHGHISSIDMIDHILEASISGSLDPHLPTDQYFECHLWMRQWPDGSSSSWIAEAFTHLTLAEISFWPAYCKNRFRIIKVVPSGAPISSSALLHTTLDTAAVSQIMLSLVFVISSTMATAEMLDNASPRNPREETPLKGRPRFGSYWWNARRNATRNIVFFHSASIVCNPDISDSAVFDLHGHLCGIWHQ